MTTQPPTDEREGLPSASGADKWYNCPGSVAAEALCPPSEDSPEASQGTAIHLAMQVGQNEGLDFDEVTITERLSEIKKAAVEDWHTTFNLDPAKTTYGTEERFWVYGDGRKITSAKLDLFLINGTHAIILDYKSGFLSATAAFKNVQLKIQALALGRNFQQLEHIRVAIAQCRFEARYDSCDYTEVDLYHALAELHLMDWRSRQPDAPRHAGTWCRYCRANGVCKEAAAWSMMPLVKVMPAPRDLDKAAALDRVNRMELPELAFINERAALTRTILDAVKDRIKTYDNDQLATVGLMKGAPGKTREVNDFQALFNTLFTEVGITLDEFKAWVKVGLTAMEETCIKKLSANRSITQKAAKQILANITEPFITFTPSEPRIQKLKE